MFKLFLLSIFLLSPSLLFADSFAAPLVGFRSDYTNRQSANMYRVDPRLNYFYPGKGLNCVRASFGVCSGNSNAPGASVRFKNSMREKESDRLHKLRPWL